MDEKNQTPNITFGNARAETLRFGGAGFNIVRAAGFEYVVHLLYVLKRDEFRVFVQTCWP